MSAEQPGHLHVVAWIFIAIADPFGKTAYASPLSMLLAVADAYNHAIPTAKEVEHGIRDLSSAGLISVDGLSFRLTTRGQVLWTEISGKPSMRQRFERARRALRDTGCVAHASGWSLDQHVWEDALGAYSSQYALELKRRRNQS